MCEDYYRGFYDAYEAMADEDASLSPFFASEQADCIVGLVGEFHDQIARFAKSEFKGRLRVIPCGRSIVFEYDAYPDYHCGCGADECEHVAPELPEDYLERLEAEFFRLLDEDEVCADESHCQPVASGT